MTRRPDPSPPVVARFDADRIKASTVAGRVKRAVAEALRDSGRSREAIAAEMTAFLGGEPVKTSVLAQYTSTANDGHNMPAYRLVALFAATRDVRLINALLESTGAIAVDAKYEALIRREMLREERERIEREIHNADEQWRSGR